MLCFLLNVCIPKIVSNPLYVSLIRIEFPSYPLCPTAFSGHTGYNSLDCLLFQWVIKSQMIKHTTRKCFIKRKSYACGVKWYNKKHKK